MWQCPNCGRIFENTNKGHFCGKGSSIDDYIAEQPVEIQPILCKIRETIHKAAPDADERISWRMPTFWQGENLIHFAAFRKHIGIYPGDLSFTPFDERLTGYHRSKGAIQFSLDKPIDYELIADITRWRVSCASAKNIDNNDLNINRMKRPIHDIPNFITSALDKNGLWDQYRARPPYQRNDYIGWIIGGKREETRQKRLTQMLSELRAGDAYMGMAYKSVTKP